MIEQPLRGWKDIAAFLGTSSRTAQRWERELALPVHRLRTTTGSVVSAYPSELDTWRRRVGADLRSAGDADASGDDLDLNDNDGASEGNAIEPAPGALPSSALARRSFPGVRWLAVAAALIVVTAAGIWLWPSQQAPGGSPSTAARRSAIKHGPGGVGVDNRQQGSADGAAGATVLRFTSGASTARLRVGSDEMATLVLPGIPELRVRAIPSRSELTVELYWKSAAGRAARDLNRATALRLVRGEPGLFEVSGATPIVIVWEGPAAKPG